MFPEDNLPLICTHSQERVINLFQVFSISFHLDAIIGHQKENYYPVLAINSLTNVSNLRRHADMVFIMRLLNLS